METRAGAGDVPGPPRPAPAAIAPDGASMPFENPAEHCSGLRGWRSVPPLVPPFGRFDREFPCSFAAVSERVNPLCHRACRTYLRTPTDTAVKPGGQVVAGSNPVSPITLSARSLSARLQFSRSVRARPGSICDSLAANGGGKYLTNVRSMCPSSVLRHLVTRKHVRDTSVRRRVAGRHYPIHRRRCDTLQHRRFHTGSLGSGFESL